MRKKLSEKDKRVKISITLSPNINKKMEDSLIKQVKIN